MTSSYAHNRFLSDVTDNDVTDAGNVNLDSTLTTSQDQFTLNQEMITKKYVDDTCTRIVQPIIASVNYNSNEIDTLKNTTSTISNFCKYYDKYRFNHNSSELN